MKNILILILSLICLSSCFSTKGNDDEEAKARRIRDSIANDSIMKRRATPDTTAIIYKRSMHCEGKQMITFDRVKILSGQEAHDYAERHRQFGDNSTVIVNQEEILETLPVDEKAPILFIDKDSPENASAKYPGYREYDIDDIDEIPFGQVFEIIVQYRSVKYMRQLDYDNDLQK